MERFRPKGSTDEVSFRTTRPVRQTLRSQISHVVLDSPTWEGSTTFYLETSAHVQTYARNDHLYLAIPYTFAGVEHVFLPDFVVRLANGLNLLLEVKGMETEQDREKSEAAKRWCDAVNAWGKMGRWVFDPSQTTGRRPDPVGETRVD
ncbi:MAG: hypothetical protein HW416_3648 [Chloroflexi bacterium]|nr:hypothetical protein [Chloroflexota bacterium]